mgnify:FL=1
MARFNVGVETVPGRRLGFGRSDQEIEAEKRRALARQMGLEAQPGVEMLDRQQIFRLGFETQRQREMEERQQRTFQQQEARIRAQQLQEQKDEQIEFERRKQYLTGLKHPSGEQRMTPLEIEQAAATPQMFGYAHALLRQETTQENKEAQEAVKRQARHQQAVAFAQQYPDAEDQQLAYGMAMNEELGGNIDLIKSQVGLRQEQRKEIKRAQAVAAKEEEKRGFEAAKEQKRLADEQKKAAAEQAQDDWDRQYKLAQHEEKIAEGELSEATRKWEKEDKALAELRIPIVPSPEQLQQRQAKEAEIRDRVNRGRARQRQLLEHGSQPGPPPQQEDIETKALVALEQGDDEEKRRVLEELSPEQKRRILERLRQAKRR